MNHYVTMDVSQERTSKPTQLEFETTIQKNLKTVFKFETVKEFSEQLIKGYTICPAIFKNNYRDGINYMGQTIFGIDLDKNSTQEYIDSLADKYGLIVNLQHPSFSDTPEYRKRRIYFFINKFIDNEEERYYIQRNLMNVFSECDVRCIDSARCYFGCNEIYSINETLNDINHVIEILRPISEKDNVLIPDKNKIINQFKEYETIELSDKAKQHFIDKVLNNIKSDIYNCSNKHDTLLTKSNFCGSLISAGLLNENHVKSFLFECICMRKIKSRRKALKTINDGVEYGKRTPFQFKDLKKKKVKLTNKELNEYIKNHLKQIKNNENVLLVDKYIVEVMDKIQEYIDRNNGKTLLLNCATNSGKTYTFLNYTKSKILLIQPYTTLIKQSVETAENLNRSYSYVYGNLEPDYMSDVIICTYDGLRKILNDIRGISWISDNCLLIVDEAHNLTTSADFNFRQNVIRSITKAKDMNLFKKIIYMTATPIYDSNLDNVDELIIRLKEARTKKLNIIQYKNRIESLINYIKKYVGKQLIFLNNIDICNKLFRLLTKLGYRCKVVNSKLMSDESLKEFTDSGEFPENIDIIITTSILGEGFRILNNIDCLHILSKLSSEQIHQFSERPKYEAVKNVLIYRKSIWYDDYKYFDYDESRDEIVTKAKADIKIKNGYIKANTYLIGEDIQQSRKYTKSEKELKSKENNLWNCVSNLAEDKINFNIIYKENNKYELNDLGINYILWQRRTNYEWCNIDVLISSLINNYNFIVDDEIIIEDDTTLTNEHDIIITEDLIDNFKSLDIKFEKIIESIEIQLPDLKEYDLLKIKKTEDITLSESKTYTERFNSINLYIKDKKECLEVLKGIGMNNTTKFNNTIKSLNIKQTYNLYKNDFDVNRNNSDFKFLDNVYTKFELNKSYTSKEIFDIMTSIYKEHKYFGMEFKIKELTITKSTQIFKLFFKTECKQIRNKTELIQTYTTLNYNGYRNFIE
jgi:hypothetical protein